MLSGFMTGRGNMIPESGSFFLAAGHFDKIEWLPIPVHLRPAEPASLCANRRDGSRKFRLFLIGKSIPIIWLARSLNSCRAEDPDCSACLSVLPDMEFD